ncbi:MAG: MBL fold metallo-hydrolase, partial [Solirubrobacteraceae bacterium]
MFFRQVLYRDLGCASYVLGDCGEAIVVDPRFDVDIYVDIAVEEGLQITHIIDTHDHADHVSGRERLAAITGAQTHRPARPADPRSDDLEASDELQVGSLRVRMHATPGHRPEHLALVVSDESRSPEPWLILSGDSLLVGDLARPDLAVEAELGASDLHASLRSLLALGDHVEVWPGHIGGSLCGGAGLNGKTSSTIGYERRNNRLLALDEPAFVQSVVTDIPARPPNVPDVVE